MRMPQRRSRLARSHQPGNVRNVRQQHRTALVCDAPELRPVRHPRVRGVAGNQQLGPVLHCQGAHRAVIQPLGGRVQSVRHAVVVGTAAVGFGAVAQVPALHQVQPHHRFAGL